MVRVTKLLVQCHPNVAQSCRHWCVRTSAKEGKEKSLGLGSVAKIGGIAIGR